MTGVCSSSIFFPMTVCSTQHPVRSTHCIKMTHILSLSWSSSFPPFFPYLLKKSDHLTTNFPIPDILIIPVILLHISHPLNFLRTAFRSTAVIRFMVNWFNKTISPMLCYIKSLVVSFMCEYSFLFFLNENSANYVFLLKKKTKKQTKPVIWRFNASFAFYL